ncbi:MAG: hypothetical protein LC772_05965, partial [Chloroflexi bacterium]|nr:hypothetical protein [Chloroflexota bacterium]
MTPTTYRMTGAAQLRRRFGKPVISVALLILPFAKHPIVEPLMAQPPTQASNQPAATPVPNDGMVAIPVPAQPDAIELGTGPLPGVTRPVPESWHSQYGVKFARNVTV